MPALEALRDAFPEAARDIRLNLEATLGGQSSLASGTRWGVAVASAIASRNRRLWAAVIADARHAQVEETVIDDARAAAALMAMNNVYYRFRHLIDKPAYGDKPARLRMNRLVKPAGNKIDFELFCLAVSAINGCETCMQAHERTVCGGGLTEDQVHDAVRIAATIQGAALSLELDPRDAATLPALSSAGA